MNSKALSRTNYRSVKRQEGFALLYAVFLIALLAAMAAAIDIARLYLAQRGLQQQANIAALDSARVVSRCNNPTIPVYDDIVASVLASLARNGVADPDAEYDTWTVEHGTVAVDDGTQFRVLQPNTVDNSDAVRVTLQRDMPNPILPFLGGGSSNLLTASATATQSALGSFYISTGLLSIDTSNSALLNPLLSGLLGGSVSLTAVDYTGLLGVGISMEHIATAVGLTVQDLSDPLALSTETPLLSDFIDGLATALSGEVSGTITSLLQDLADAADDGGNLVPLGDLFAVVDSAGAEVPFVDALSLLTALGMASQADSGGASPILLDGFPTGLVNIPGVATVQLFLKVIEPPQFSGMGRPGEARAKTAQIQLGIRLEAGAILASLISSVTSLINRVLFGLVGALTGLDLYVGSDLTSLNIGVDVDVAAAEGVLDQITCPTASSPVIEAEVSADSAVVALSVGTFTGPAVSMPDLDSPGGSAEWDLLRVEIDATCLLLLCLVNLGEANLDVALELTSLDVGSEDIQFDTFDQFTLLDSTGPSWVYGADGRPGTAPVTNNPQTEGSTATLGLTLGLDTQETGSGLIDLASGLIGDVVALVLSLLDDLLSVVNGLVSALIQPLLSLLGVQVGEVTATMNTLSLDQPHLVSTEIPAAEE